MINLTSSQLRKAADLQDQIVKLQTQLAGILVNPSTWIPETIKVAKPAKKGMSAAGRAKVAAAQKARWAKVNAVKDTPKAVVKPVAKVVAAKPAKKTRKISAEGIARIKAAQKARWAAIKAAKK